jgi:hypothetical protein
MATVANQFAAAVILLLISLPANAQIPQQQLPFGSSVWEVLNKFPGTSRVENGERLNNGLEIELAREPHVDIASHSFAEKFFFSSGKLTRVMLTLNEPYPYGVAHPIFEELLGLLRAEYGPELALREKRAMTMNRSEVEWLSGDTRIDLCLQEALDVLAILNVTYKTSAVRE